MNSLGYAVRTPTGVYKKWRNLSQYTKKTHAGLANSRGKTGGGPSDEPLDATTVKIIISCEMNLRFWAFREAFKRE